MPWSGNGSFTRTDGTRSGSDLHEQQRQAPVRVRADLTDNEMNDLVGGLEKCLTRDGENSPTANISWGNRKITNLADGTADGDAVAYGQDGLQLVSTDTGVTAGPILELYRNGGAGTSGDDLGQLRFTGQGSAGNKTIFGAITAEIADPANTSEDSRLLFGAMVQGTLCNVFRCNASGTFQFDSYNADANIGPVVTLRRESVSPADADAGGAFEFDFNNDAAEQTTFARINAVADDVSDGTEDGHIKVQAMRAGSLVTCTGPGVLQGSVNPASGIEVSFTGIHADARRLTLGFSGLSTNGTHRILVQLGTSGGFEVTGYVAAVSEAGAIDNAGFRLNNASTSGGAYYGQLILTNINPGGNFWVGSGTLVNGNGGAFALGGAKALSGVLTQLRVTMNGNDMFDAGTVNLLVE